MGAVGNLGVAESAARRTATYDVNATGSEARNGTIVQLCRAGSANGGSNRAERTASYISCIESGWALVSHGIGGAS